MADNSKYQYTNDDLVYVKENISSTTYAVMAKHIGVTEVSLKNKIKRWRAAGEEVPVKREKVMPGEQRMRNVRGKLTLMEKNDEGYWVRAAKERRVPQRSNKELKSKVMITKNRKISVPHRLNKKDYQQRKEFAGKETSTEGLVALYIPELKMTVHHKPSRNAEDVRAQYLALQQHKHGLLKVSRTY